MRQSSQYRLLPQPGKVCRTESKTQRLKTCHLALCSIYAYISQTGLAQTWNLYLVAHVDDIYCYQPCFPSQELTQPALIIHTQPSAPGLSGHLDPRAPRAINNLVVAQLGTDEIVAVVRDDGDAEAYRIRHIADAIERRSQPGNMLDINAVEIKAFFHRNVGNSAWGLAVHTEARIIAVSSNNHEVSIYAFALVQDAATTDETVVLDPNTDVPSHRPDLRPSLRTHDIHVVLKFASHNIPAISFCNTGADPEAKWLLSTDVAGLLLSYNLHDSQCQAMRVGHGLQSRHQSDFDRVNAGWAVLFLDTRSFDAHHTLHEAMGRDALPAEMHLSRPLWDLSSTKSRLEESYAVLNRRDVASVEDGNFASNDRLRATGATGYNASRSPDMVGDDDAVVDYTGVDTPPEDEVELSSDTPLADGLDSDENSSDEESQQTARIGFANPSRSLCDDLPCPIMHTSVRNIYLLQPGDGVSPNSHLPSMLLADPTAQIINHVDGEALKHFQRCNMHAQIPSLGVVIIGNQKGRVVILRLNKVRQQVDIASPTQSLKTEKEVYVMRVDHILPWASQERAGHRPMLPLHGLAVGPMQGTEGLADDQKRWRLMMMYQDHTVLSYEIGRAEMGVQVDVRDLMI